MTLKTLLATTALLLTTGCGASDFMGVYFGDNTAPTEEDTPCITAANELECLPERLMVLAIEENNIELENAFILDGINDNINNNNCSGEGDTSGSLANPCGFFALGPEMGLKNISEEDWNALIEPYVAECETKSAELNEILESVACDPDPKTCYDLEPEPCKTCVTDKDPLGLSAWLAIGFETCLCPEESIADSCSDVCADPNGYFFTNTTYSDSCQNAISNSSDTVQSCLIGDFLEACSQNIACSTLYENMNQCN